MAYDIYKGGAWQPPDNVQKYEAGAWKDAEAVHRYKDGAWQEVWSNVKLLTEQSNNIANGYLDISDDTLEARLFKFCDCWQGTWSGTMSGGGTIVFYLDGDWTDPEISFTWEGGCVYQLPAETGEYRRLSAGSVSIYSRSTSGSEKTTSAAPTIGSTQLDCSSTELGSYSGKLTGTYNRIGLSIYMSSFGQLDGSMELIVRDFLIDGKKIGFPLSSEFDRLIWD